MIDMSELDKLHVKLMGYRRIPDTSHFHWPSRPATYFIGNDKYVRIGFSTNVNKRKLVTYSAPDEHRPPDAAEHGRLITFGIIPYDVRDDCLELFAPWLVSGQWFRMWREDWLERRIALGDMSEPSLISEMLSYPEVIVDSVEIMAYLSGQWCGHDG